MTETYKFDKEFFKRLATNFLAFLCLFIITFFTMYNNGYYKVVEKEGAFEKTVYKKLLETESSQSLFVLIFLVLFIMTEILVELFIFVHRRNPRKNEADNNIN